jgi:hypothetical protein
MEGCTIDLIINFMNPFNDVEFIDQIHYDIWVLDENGNRLRSYAEDLGRKTLFNGFGQVHLVLPVEENAGIVPYTIFVHGTGPEFQVPDPKLGGYVTIEIEIDENPLIGESKGDVVSSSKIPDWIKFPAGVWADGTSSDDEFINAIKFLIEDKIIVIPPTAQGSSSDSNEIPSWIKFPVGVWADGDSSDDEFINAIQFLITEGIMRISS